MDKRGCIIYLPNEDKLELSVNCKQLGKDLWDVVVSKLELREEDYFGLKYKAAGEHFSWLQMDKKIIDHDMETKSVEYPLEFIFSVKFYEDSVTVHKHATTVELIFLYAQNQIYREEIHVSCDMSLELAALALQVFYGDFVSDDVAFSNYKKLSCLPRTVILELPSIEYCEDQVISWYKSFCGISRGQAILLYMSKAEKLANYGVHFFKVKDKTRITWWLGISNKGIFQYNYTDTINPHTVFQWRNLENLYFREKKFSVEVCSGHKRSHSSGFTNISDKTAKKSSNSNHHPKTHTWYGSPQLIKSIWIMAIAQHQFYWDRKQSSKSKSNSNKTNATNLRNALDKNINSLIIPPTEDKNMPKKNHNDKYGQFTSFKKAPSHNNGRIPSSSHHHKQPERSPEILKWEKKMVTDLKKRKLDLEDRLYDKVQELKAVCLEEFGITEKLPIDYIRYMTIDEEKPVLRKKIETEYPVRLRHHNNNEKNRYDPTIANQLQQLESDCELLHQITNAAYKLAYDPSSRGRIKRNRLQSYKKSLKKLQEVENKIDELRLKQGKDPAMRHSTFITTSDTEILAAMKECSIDEKSEHSSLSDGILLEDEASISSGAEALSTHSTPASLHPDTSSADIDLDDDISVKRSRTPPPTRSKLAWLESPKVKGHKQQQMSPNHSYPVLPSPTSNRSTASSGADTPPHGVQGRTWKQHKWEHPRHQGDKVSSLDSLESIGSRKSNEKNLSGSPSRRRISPNGENANAMRIARATESARAHKVSLREKQRTAREPSHRTGTVNPILEIVQGTAHDVGKDSRTSLTDSGHGTDSRVQSYHEDELARRKHGANAIRRDISDSSLSELSTQSNPAALPSSGHVPKFVPYFMSKPRAASHTPVQDISSQQTESSTLRKRSSSFTESGNTIQKPVSRRDNPRTLSRSKTHYESDTLTKDSVRNEAFASDESFGASSNKSHPALSTSQSANELPPPVFETNLNICKQYLSRSQGQLAAQNNQTTATQNVPTQDVKVSEITYTSPNQNWSSMIANPADVGSKNSANNNNNKLNFGQIYQLSQGHLGAHNARLLNRSETPQGTSLAHNIPRGNSLDSILNRGHSTGTDLNPDTVKNYGLETEHGNKFHGTQDIQYPHYPAVSTTKSEMQQHHDAANFPPNMSVMDRDKFNNEAFQDIQGMGWVPSLDEYGSRASVAESLPAKSKKEDIMELLQQHIAHNWIPRRTPSTTGTNRKLQARIRAEMMRDKETKPTSSDPTVKTWEGYKQSVQTMKRSTQQPTIGHSTASVDIFAHKQPPPISATQQNSQTILKKQFASDYSQHTIRKGYIDKNGYISLNERRLPSHHGNFQVSSQSSDYPDYTVPSPFERGYLSATLPRKYVMKDTSSKHPPTTTYPVNDLPRTYSYRSGESRNFTPSANFSSSPENLARTHSHHPSEVFYPRPKSSYTDQSTGRYQNLSQQHSTNYTSSTHPFTSLSQNFPATGNMANMTDSRKIAVGYKDTMSQQEKSTHKMTQPTNYHQQQQISMSETWKQPGSLLPTQQQYTSSAHQGIQQHPYHYHHMGHQGLMPTTANPRSNHEPPRRTASADDLLWPEQRDGQSYNLRSQQGTLV